MPIRLYSQLSTIKKMSMMMKHSITFIFSFLPQMKKNIHKSFLSRSS
ncbi:hypothetical protein STM14_1006 [Salmonella enterica subsp. enterica serovar Typhimurium str. 14028S]|uniref:Uncharacterized protein n=1 Tax=Salmonella typhimurium (strain 14028s / SGSC 2262) TaxID=588858 RepID=A0A0F6AZ28_SALT1|nr:hypothetical protein STM14_1006 [Salmonella enterica subsp. enterica serovar Typhimurium str. 14028S]